MYWVLWGFFRGNGKENGHYGFRVEGLKGLGIRAYPDLQWDLKTGSPRTIWDVIYGFCKGVLWANIGDLFFQIFPGVWVGLPE